MTLLSYSDQNLSARSINMLMALLMLIVVSSHCSMAFAKGVDQSEFSRSLPSADTMPDHCGGMQEADEQHSNQTTDRGCWDGDCPSSFIGALTAVPQQVKLDLQDAPLASFDNSFLPMVRAGPCLREPSPDLSDFSTPPLIYSLCVLRL